MQDQVPNHVQDPRFLINSQGIALKAVGQLNLNAAFHGKCRARILKARFFSDPDVLESVHLPASGHSIILFYHTSTSIDIN
jgi:hypothetical protein